VYWFVPASGLPSFFPGFKAVSAHVAVKHAIGSLIIALVLLAFAPKQAQSARRLGSLEASPPCGPLRGAKRRSSASLSLASLASMSFSA
jgi:hypothetical protein